MKLYKTQLLNSLNIYVSVRGVGSYDLREHKISFGYPTEAIAKSKKPG